jgi:hypothetical protein
MSEQQEHQTGTQERKREQGLPEDEQGSSADVKAPFEPHEDDDTPWGDSDQHSDA